MFGYTHFFTHHTLIAMSIAKTIEVTATSNDSFEDAVQQAASEVSETVSNVKRVYVKDLMADVDDAGGLTYRAHCQVTFVVARGEM